MFSRREWLSTVLAGFVEPKITVAPFRADVTVPLGHPLMGGGVAPAKKILDPLEAIGFVLRGHGDPVVVCVVDWCEIRNDAYSRWREVLADAAGTSSARVILSAIHQHDTPIADLEAERILRSVKAVGTVCDLDFHEKAVQRVATALKAAKPRRVTHVGTGKAKVESVASNRRFTTKDGAISFGRMSATRDPFARSQPEGLIDPWLRTLSLWDADMPLVALSAYSVHPMSNYGRGEVSSDFPGLARRQRQATTPGVVQIYASGCSGNTVAGKYNDGAAENRLHLAGRLHDAMKIAWDETKRVPLTAVGFRSVPYRLVARGGEFAPSALKERLRTEKKPFGQCLAALGLSWRKRADAGAKLDLPALTLGPARLLLLPGEAYVEYQLYAQSRFLREKGSPPVSHNPHSPRAQSPDAFVMALGYGESAPGYVPTEKHWEEKDANLRDWCWVAPGAQSVLEAAIRTALDAPVPER